MAEGRYSTSFSPEFDPYFFSIGQLAILWAEFEFSVNDAIWELSNVSRKAGSCMTWQLIGPAPRFRCLVSLLNLRKVPQELVKAFNVLSSDADSLGRQRNRYLHDPIMLDTTDNSIQRLEITADRFVKHGFIPIEVGEIGKLCIAIDELDLKFEDLYLRVLAETPAWTRTEFAQSPGIQRNRPRPARVLSKPEPPLQ